MLIVAPSPTRMADKVMAIPPGTRASCKAELAKLAGGMNISTRSCSGQDDITYELDVPLVAEPLIPLIEVGIDELF